MNIVAKDGKGGFRTTEECLRYEADLDRKAAEAKEKRIKLETEKEKEYKEIIELCEELFKKARAYDEKYDVELLSSNLFYPFSPQLLPNGFKFSKLFL